MIKYFIIIYIFSAVLLFSQQHDHHTKKEFADTSAHASKMSTGHGQENTLLTRQGSGTAWLPDNSPMYGYMVHSKNWMFMFHGNIFLRYNSQDISNKGTRGDSEFDAPNWIMGMARREIGDNGNIRLTAMFSFDRLIGGGDGYPLLFQSGETWQNRPLIDRQHPHDLISEMSVEYTQSFSREIDLTAYLAYPGEPAVGPVAFMHRTSALNNPDAPLAHHWQDATHITFGVGTLGLTINNYKIEGSIFTGIEPDENRYDFDKPKFDSYSVRLSSNPGKKIALQVSHAFLKSPEELEPETNVRRTTASIIHNHVYNEHSYISTALIWGLNNKIDRHNESSVLLESTFSMHKLNMYGRYEWIEKSAHELGIEDLPEDEVFVKNALTLGANYLLLKTHNTELRFGLQGSLYKPADEFKPYYGNTPLALEIYIRITPSIMTH